MRIESYQSGAQSGGTIGRIRDSFDLLDFMNSRVDSFSVIPQLWFCASAETVRYSRWGDSIIEHVTAGSIIGSVVMSAIVDEAPAEPIRENEDPVAPHREEILRSNSTVFQRQSLACHCCAALQASAGQSAVHAWASSYLQGRGWKDFSPAHGAPVRVHGVGAALAKRFDAALI